MSPSRSPESAAASGSASLQAPSPSPCSMLPWLPWLRQPGSSWAPTWLRPSMPPHSAGLGRQGSSTSRPRVTALRSCGRRWRGRGIPSPGANSATAQSASRCRRQGCSRLPFRRRLTTWLCRRQNPPKNPAFWGSRREEVPSHDGYAPCRTIWGHAAPLACAIHAAVKRFDEDRQTPHSCDKLNKAA